MMPSCKCVARGLAFLLIVFPLAVQATPTDRIIIKVSETMRPMVLAGGGPAPRARERVSALSAAVGHEVVYLRAMSGGADVVRLPRAMPLEQVQAMAEAMARLPGVEYAEPDIWVYPTTLPDDPRFNEQWNLQSVTDTRYGIDAPGAWAISTGARVVVAVLDTGILPHRELDGKVLPGFDFVDFDNDPSDPGDYVTEAESIELGCPEQPRSTWHGIHVSGTVAAASDNGFGVAGISWGAEILPVRVLGKCGGSISGIADAMRWAVGLPVAGVPQNENPARILNLSLGGEGACGPTARNAIQDVNAAGAIVIVAAGNTGANLSQTPVSPAVCPGVVTVAASNRQGERASYSSYGSAVSISAPGGDCAFVGPLCVLDESLAILSTLNDGETEPDVGTEALGWRIGTSMAVPHVSGVVALMLGLDPNLTREELSYLLNTSVTPFPAGSICEAEGGCGSGILNAAQALQATLDFEGLPPLPSGSGGGGLIGLPWLLFLGGYLLGFICITRLTTPRTTPASAP